MRDQPSSQVDGARTHGYGSTQAAQGYERLDPSRGYEELEGSPDGDRLPHVYEELKQGPDAVSTDAISEQAPITGNGAAPRGRVSILVVARNQSAYLADCLHSIFNQTVKAAEVIYLDDGSEDGSLDVARRFETFGLTVLARPHRGVAAARNEAAAKAEGDLLLFVDGDNILPPDFLELHLHTMQPDVGFTYPAKQHFGRFRQRWEPPGYDRDALWDTNYIDTSALVRRELFEAAGRWRETEAVTLWDWDLFLRVGRYAQGARSDATLYYRQHDRNWSLLRDTQLAAQFGTYKGIIRRAAARVCVCCAYSGRLPKLLPAWLDAVAAATAELGCDPPALFVLDDSPNGFWSDAASVVPLLSTAFRSVRIDRVHVGVSAPQRREDRTATARFLSVLYNRFLAETEEEVLWFLEDDIIVPADAGRTLYRFLLDGESPRAAVSGFYRSRHEPCYVVSHTNGRTVTHARELPTAPESYDLAGTGCLMIFRPLARAKFAPFWQVPANGAVVHAHDWVYTWQLKEQGCPVQAHPGVVCRHHLTETEWV